MGIFSIVVVVLLLTVLLVLLRFKRKEDENLFPYHKKQLFFSASELAFYQTLIQVAGDDYVVFAHVHMSDLLKISPELSRRKKLYYFGRIRAEQVDFLLCEPVDFHVKAAVLLTSKANVHSSQGARESFIVQACNAAKLVLLQLREQKEYSVDEVRDLLSSALERAHKKTKIPSKHHKQQPIDGAKPSDIDEDHDENFVELAFTELDENEPHIDDDNAPRCPKCSAEMVLRKADKGRRAGKYFFMCSRYPECTRAMPVKPSQLS
jgi:hypothetical protein